MNNTVINTEADLIKLCQELVKEKVLSLDTEFIREDTYYPKACLVQLAGNGTQVCVDVLSIRDLTPLFHLLYNPNILKIMHSGSQDMEIFYHIKKTLPAPIFDTQIATGMLNYGDQISYALMVKTLLNIELDKSHSRTDWSKRPLDEKQVQYALDDVRYLHQCYPILKKELAEKNRSAWVETEFHKLTDPKTYTILPEELWRKVKHVRKLERQQLPLLQALTSWRESHAIKRDRPRRWIVSDEALIQLCQTNIDSAEALEQANILSEKQKHRYSEEILNCILTAQKIPEDKWPVLKDMAVPTNQEKALLKKLSTLIRNKSEELGLSPSLLATRRDLEELISGNRTLPVLQDWRLEVLGKALLQLIEKQ